jgi:FixJ family two-component response regulator
MSDATVAVIDDNADWRSSVTLLLSIEGFAVNAYASPAAFFADTAARHSCLIVDQNLPGATGLELIARLRGQGSDIPILLVSGWIDAPITERAAELTVQKVLERPLEPDDILAFVHTYCRDFRR